MRLTSRQQRSILNIVRQHMGPQAGVRIYGSRVQDELRGSDLDLMVEGRQHLAPMAKAALQMDPQDALQMPVVNAAEALTLALEQRVEDNDPLPAASKVKGGAWVEPSASVQAAT